MERGRETARGRRNTERENPETRSREVQLGGICVTVHIDERSACKRRRRHRGEHRHCTERQEASGGFLHQDPIQDLEPYGTEYVRISLCNARGLGGSGSAALRRIHGSGRSGTLDRLRSPKIAEDLNTSPTTSLRKCRLNMWRVWKSR